MVDLGVSDYSFGIFKHFLHLTVSKFNAYCMYPIELEIKNITHADKSDSYLDLYLENEREWQKSTELYDKNDDFIFPLLTFHLYVPTFQQHMHKERIYLS